MPPFEDRVERALELVTAFLNSVDVEAGEDDLVDLASARAWLTRHGLLKQSDAMTQAELDTAVELRSALRELAGANHTGQPAADAGERLSAITRRLPLHAAVDSTGDVRLAAGGHGGERAAARVVSAVIEASMSDAWSRVKICPADDCLWAFVDRSKNQSRRWCAMGTCGNRQKTRAYRDRHREQQH